MARREWADKLYEKAQRLKEPDDQFSRLPDYLVLRLLKAEHARVVRIVKRIGTKKCPDWLPMNHYDDGYIMACEHILAALQKGRA